ncbi:hypothetical protein [Thermosyntropha sp.]|uniref:hypothetical protein n=1 Tax=Thermosyntropha sp. TaxID=2740820 RepID=UPI0025D3DECB|nr:hypothetical protein [Thermosyntropha sp.]MBO8158408.1 hypothetical protein [Thermosyntropha sp.]
MAKKHIFCSTAEQAIDLEHDQNAEEAVIHYRPCENVVETKRVKRQELENIIFQALKDKYF